MPGKDDPLLDMAASAKKLEVEYVTMRKYWYRLKKNVEAGARKPGDIPWPDEMIGRSPAWRESTWDKWLPTRPGPGAGGGPKPKAIAGGKGKSRKS
ncbi:hypothetical protein GCM10023196_037270 [Actinoallomurus vinaceus]|uniref:Uncharacterized protein n=1 Tax=Actinoallomurus vinaceus TaxID=1080074 RepID=A0ABP8UC49_9ACTN